MHYRRFGRTNLWLSHFSLGMMRCIDSVAIAQTTLQKALSLGINHIETAQGYGNSEIYLGQALQAELRRSREQLYLTTKLTPTPDAATMAERIQRSLERLQVNYVDCLAIHGLNTWEHLAWVTAPDGCMSAIAAAVNAGQIHHVGFSSHGPLALIQAAITTELFAFVNLHYYYFFQHNAPAVALAHQKDLGVFIISPADKGGQLHHPSETLRQLCQPFTPLELTYRFLLSDHRITTLSVGPSQPDELGTSLQLTNPEHPLSVAEQASFTRLEQRRYQTLGTEQCQQCYQCLPCPEDIHIPEILRLRNLAVAYDLQAFGQYRYQMFENAGHWFPGRRGDHCTECGDCLPRCPENLNIPTLLADAHQRLKGPTRRRLWES